MHFKYRLIIVFSLSLMFLFCWACTEPVDASEVKTIIEINNTGKIVSGKATLN